MPAYAAFYLVLFGCIAPVLIWLVIPMHDAISRSLGQLADDVTLMLGCIAVWHLLDDNGV